MVNTLTSTTGCPTCYEPIGPNDRFCESCGASLILNSDTLPPPTSGGCTCGSTAFTTDGFCEQCGLKQPAANDRQPAANDRQPAANDRQPAANDRQPAANDHVERSGVGVGGVSDKARKRRNEDAFAFATVAESAVVAVVCDGVSAVPRSDEAAQAAADVSAKILERALGRGFDDGDIGGAVEASQAAVAALATGTDVPSCTWVAFVAHGNAFTVGWVGDSRVYWYDGDTTTQLTADHSVVGELVASGVLTDDAALVHPDVHVITRWLGADASLPIECDVRTHPIEAAGRAIVCSDGMWNSIRTADLHQLMTANAAHRRPEPQSPVGRHGDRRGRDRQRHRGHRRYPLQPRSQRMSFTATTFQNEYVPTGGTQVHAVVTVSSGELAPQAVQSTPTSRALVIVIDTSGSMAEPKTKIKAARTAVAEAVGQIPDGTWFAVVAGTDSTEMVFPAHTGMAMASPQTRAEAAASAQQLRASGGTAISTWLRGIAYLFSTVEASIRSAILITDGVNQSESAELFESVLRELAGTFECDCRGVGAQWNPTELRAIASRVFGRRRHDS